MIILPIKKFTKMIRFIGICLLLLFPITSLTATQSKFPELTGNMKKFKFFDEAITVPEVSFFDKDGKEFSLKDFKGKVVLLHFWATWCPPCLREMPSLDELQEKFSESKDDIVVLTLSFDRSGKIDRIEEFFSKNNIHNLKIYIDEQEKLAQALNTFALPSTFIVSKSGKIIGKYSGGTNWASEDAQKLLSHYLKSK